MRSIIKKVWENDEWVDGVFYEAPNDISCIVWLRENYGRSRYSVTWWKTINEIWMRDKIYTHWKLCE